MTTSKNNQMTKFEYSVRLQDNVLGRRYIKYTVTAFTRDQGSDQLLDYLMKHKEYGMFDEISVDEYLSSF